MLIILPNFKAPTRKNPSFSDDVAEEENTLSNWKTNPNEIFNRDDMNGDEDVIVSKYLSDD